MSTEYCQKNKEKLQKEALGRSQNLSEEKKKKKRQHTLETYKIFLKIKTKAN